MTSYSTLLPGQPAIVAFWVALIVSGLAAAPLYRLLIRLKSLQTISAFVPEHQQKQGTPTMGGLIIAAGALAGWIAFELCGGRGSTGYILAFVLFGSIGFVDDYVVPRALRGKRGLGWKQKILLELIFALVPFIFFPNRSVAELGAGVFLVLFFANAFNFTDGLDGLAGGVGLALLPALAALQALRAWSDPIAEMGVAAVLVGGLIPFLYLNAPPAKVFMGDVGSLPIGAVIGLMVWRVQFPGGDPFHENHPMATAVSLLLICAVMVAELIPVPIQIASVKLRKKRVFLKTPIHHAFQEMKIPETTIVWRYILIQVVLGAAGLSLYYFLVPYYSPLRIHT